MRFFFLFFFRHKANKLQVFDHSIDEPIRPLISPKLVLHRHSCALFSVPLAPEITRYYRHYISYSYKFPLSVDVTTKAVIQECSVSPGSDRYHRVRN